MKTVFLNENIFENQLLKEEILKAELPDDILSVIKSDKTPLGDNPAIPSIYDGKFLEKIITKRFSDVKDEIKKIKRIDDADTDDVYTMLSELVNKCKEIERPNRDKLEKICLNYLIDFFSVPEDAIILQLALVDKVQCNSSSFTLDPVTDDDFEYFDYKQLEDLSMETHKRELINAICVGAGIKLSSDIKSYVSDIYDIDPELPGLYRKIMALNNYLLFLKEDLGLTDDDKKQIGIVNVKLGGVDEQPIIDVQAEIFPVLLAESIHGVLELFASHGLPKELSLTNQVLQRSDYVKADPWNMRIGPVLWELLSDTFQDTKTKEIPYLFKNIVELPVDRFNELMKEIFAKTKLGKQKMYSLISKARKDIIADKFKTKLNNVDADKTIITDEYLTEEEL